MHLVRVVSKRQREEKEMLCPGVQRGAGPLFHPHGCRRGSSSHPKREWDISTTMEFGIQPCSALVGNLNKHLAPWCT